MLTTVIDLTKPPCLLPKVTRKVNEHAEEATETFTVLLHKTFMHRPSSLTFWVWGQRLRSQGSFVKTRFLIRFCPIKFSKLIFTCFDYFNLYINTLYISVTGDIPWPGLIGITINSIWYWCSDQVGHKLFLNASLTSVLRLLLKQKKHFFASECVFI